MTTQKSKPQDASQSGREKKKHKRKGGLPHQKKPEWLGGKSLVAIARENQANAARLAENQRRDEEWFQKRQELEKQLNRTAEEYVNQLHAIGSIFIPSTDKNIGKLATRLKDILRGSEEFRWSTTDQGFVVARRR